MCGSVRRQNISIHALLAESDLRSFGRVPGRWVFLSTLSLRRATGAVAYRKSEQQHFYPRSPCGERRTRLCDQRPKPDISIHALLAESDPLADGTEPHATISIHALLAESDCARGRDRAPDAAISIHALLAESDAVASVRNGLTAAISIHALLAESDFLRLWNKAYS